MRMKLTKVLLNLDPAAQYAAETAITFCDDMLEFPVDQTFICGGFPRDTLLKRQWKDVDVFVTGDGVLRVKSEAGTNYGGADELRGNKTTVYQDVEINVIKIAEHHTLGSLLERMDIGLCQIGGSIEHLVKGESFCTKAFLNDWDNKTLTLTRDTRWNHVLKLMLKFRDYKLVLNGFDMSVTDKNAESYDEYLKFGLTPGTGA